MGNNFSKFNNNNENNKCNNKIVQINKKSLILQKYTMLKVLFDFKARKCLDISIKKGDELTLIDSSDPNWWICKNLKTNKQGFVPSNYVAATQNCSHEP